MARTGAAIPDAVRELDGRLRDHEYARVIIIALPESTPIREADRAPADLRRAGVEPHGWLTPPPHATR